MKEINLDTLENLCSAYLDHDAYDLDALSRWCRNTKVDVGVSKVHQFKRELIDAITHVGTVKPNLYERWTGEDLESQEEVQNRLQEIWDACFS